MCENDMQGFGNTPRGKRFFDETIPKIVTELERLNKNLGNHLGIPRHVRIGQEVAGKGYPPKSSHISLDDAPKCAAKLAVAIENKRTIGAILAGLRLLQKELAKDDRDSDILDIATGGLEVEPLSIEEIDGLCEDLTCL